MSTPSHPRRFALPRWLEVSLAAALAVVLVVTLGWNWNWFKGPIERQVSRITERDFHIDGDIEGRMGWRMRLVAHELRLSNPDWARRDHLGLADALELEFTWAQLLARRVDVVTLQRPRLSLQRDEDGEANWLFPQRGGRQWHVGDLRVVDGRLEVREPQFETDFTLHVWTDDTPREELDRSPLLLSGDGVFRGEDFTVRGGVESPLELRDQERPFRIGLRIQAGPTTARLRGQLDSWIDLRAFDLRMSMQGQDMAHLYPLLNIAFPNTAPYDLDGRLIRRGDHWEYLDIEGVVGESDIRGDVEIDAAREPTLFTAELESQRLRFQDLAGFIGLAPGEGAAQRVQGRLFPDSPLSGEGLRAMDADVQLKAHDMDGAPFEASSMDARLLLESGRVTLDPLVFGIAGGEARTEVALDANATPASARLRVDLRGLQLARLLGPDKGDGTRGTLAGRIELDGRGDSMSDLMGRSQGEMQLVLGQAHVGLAQLAAWNLDGTLPRRALGVGEDGLPVNCGVADFGVADGVAQARSLGVDTPRTVVAGEGRMLLGPERFDLRVDTHPKSPSFLTLRAPVEIGGTFLDPEFGIDAGPLILRGLAAAALYSLTPPAALLAFVETGDNGEGCVPPVDG